MGNIRSHDQVATTGTHSSYSLVRSAVVSLGERTAGSSRKPCMSNKNVSAAVGPADCVAAAAAAATVVLLQDGVALAISYSYDPPSVKL